MLSTVFGDPYANPQAKLWLNKHVYKQLITAGREALPYEYSVLLAGTDATISACFSAGSSACKDRHSFRLDGPGLFGALQAIHAAGLRWQGVLHTHPVTPAFPSQADVAGWHYPRLSYWILSFAGEQSELNVYQMVDGVFLLREYELR